MTRINSYRRRKASGIQIKHWVLCLPTIMVRRNRKSSLSTKESSPSCPFPSRYAPAVTSGVCGLSLAIERSGRLMLNKLKPMARAVVG